MDSARVKALTVNALAVPDWDINVDMCSRNDKAWKVTSSGHEERMKIAAEVPITVLT